MKLGFVTACLPGWSLSQLAVWAATHGYAALEVAAWPGLGNRPFTATHLDVDQLRPDDVRRLVADLRLEISSVAFMDNPLDPDLTESKCSFWHFRFDASVDMRVEALGGAIEKARDVHAVYIIGQNYSFGQQVSRAMKDMLARRRPDVKVVGDELHPIGTVRDFAPYIAKIRASGADTVVTGNWGNDLTLLVKAAREGGLNVNFYTFYAGSLGAVTALGDAGVGRGKGLTP